MIDYVHLFKPGRLYYRFIKGTDLDAKGFTGIELMLQLERLGYIEVRKVQPVDEQGRWKTTELRYIEKTGKHLTRKHFQELLIMKTIKVLFIIYLGMTFKGSICFADDGYLFSKDQALNMFNDAFLQPPLPPTQITPIPGHSAFQPPPQRCVTTTRTDFAGNLVTTTRCY